jgi:hypothetical protein
LLFKTLSAISLFKEYTLHRCPNVDLNYKSI